jgi:hypothetical protein
MIGNEFHFFCFMHHLPNVLERDIFEAYRGLDELIKCCEQTITIIHMRSKGQVRT